MFFSILFGREFMKIFRGLVVGLDLEVSSRKQE